MSVYSLKFTLCRHLPADFAKFSIRLVFPTPGGPSINIGFYKRYALNNLCKFDFVVFASNANSVFFIDY